MSIDKIILNEIATEAKIPGAIVLNGEWGVGKTYYWNHSVLPQLKKHKVTYLSLFGTSNLRQIKSDLCARLLLSGNLTSKLDDKLGGFSKLISSLATETGKAAGKVAEKMTGVDPLEIIKKLIPDIDPLEFFPNNTIVCLDDIERCDADLILQIMGMISFLIEERNSKVIILTNENELNKILQNKNYSEKIIWKSISYRADLSDVFDVAVNKFCAPASHSKVMKLKETVLRAFKEADYYNIRTLNKCIKWIGDLVETGMKIPNEYVRYLAFLIIYKSEKGNLSEVFELYGLSRGYLVSSKLADLKVNKNKIEEISEEDKIAYDFYIRFKGLPHTLAFKTAHNFLIENKIDTLALKEELFPKDSNSPEYKLSIELSQQDWFFKNEKNVKKLRSKGLKFLKEKKNLKIKTALNIFYGIYKIDESLKINSTEREGAFSDFIKNCNDLSENPYDVVTSIRLRSEEEKKYFDLFVNRINERRSESYVKVLKADLIKKINRGQPINFYFTSANMNSAFQTVLRDTELHKALETIYLKYPNVHYDFYMQSAGKIRDNNWSKDLLKFVLSRLKKFLNNKTLDKVEQYRFDYLIQAYSDLEK